MSLPSEKIATDRLTQAVAATPVAEASPTPYALGTSSPTVAPADAAGGADNTRTFTFPVTIHATATIAADMEDEARNTVGIDLRSAFHDDPEVATDNGATLRFERFEIGSNAAMPKRIAGHLGTLRTGALNIPQVGARSITVNAIDSLATDVVELLAVLREAVGRIEIANSEGDPILSAWLLTARALIGGEA